MSAKRLTPAAGAAIGLAVAAAGMAAGEESPAGAAGYQDGWGPSLGDTLPPLAAEDQTGDVRDLASLSGPDGLLLLVARSAVW